MVLVEDDASVLRALRREISAAGFEVVTFDRPSAVLAATLPASNACLVVDFHLPQMTGVELCEALTAAGCQLPVVLMTGDADERTSKLMGRTNAVALLAKPVARDTLLAALAKALATGLSG